MTDTPATGLTTILFSPKASPPDRTGVCRQGEDWSAQTTLDPGTPQGRKRLGQIGEIIAFDALIHNVDRVRGVCMCVCVAHKIVT